MSEITGTIHSDSVLTEQELAECEAFLNALDREKLEVLTIPLSTGNQVIATRVYTLKQTYRHVVSPLSDGDVAILHEFVQKAQELGQKK